MRIGLFLRNLDEEFQITVYRAIRDRARQRGADLVCIQGETVKGDTVLEAHPFSLASKVRFDGLLVLSSVILDTGTTSLEQALGRLLPRIPAVSVGIDVKDMASLTIRANPSLSRILEHLILDHGYRRFLYVGGPKDHRDNQLREGIFRRTLAQFLPLMPHLTADYDYGGFSESGGVEVLRRRLDGPPYDAVVAANDNMALGILRVVRIQADPAWRRCAVTGFDDIPQAALEDPALTSVHQPMDRLGAEALDLLLDQLEGKGGPRHRTIAARPVIRESCGCTPQEPTSYDKLGRLPTLEARIEGLRRAAFSAEENLRISNYLGRDLSAVGDREALVTRLNTTLQTLGVDQFHLLIHDLDPDGVPQSHLILERVGGRRTALPPGGLALGPEEVFALRTPRGQVSWDLCTFDLHSGPEHVGLALYSAADRTLPYLSASLPHVANAIRRLRLQAEQEDRNRRLEAMVRARTLELTQANEWLLQQRALLNQTLMALPIPVTVFEVRSGIIQYANPAFEARVGGQALFRSMSLFLDLPEVCEGAELTLRTHRPGRVGTIPVLAWRVALEYDGKESALAALVDLSRQKDLEAEVLHISEFERRRFGLDLHDDICQRLAGVTMYLRGLSLRAPDRPAEAFAEVRQMVEETLHLTRQYAHASFPIELELHGLDQVLGTLCETVATQTSWTCRYTSELSLLDPPLEGAPALNLYRIVQECLQNAQKHARATELAVDLRVTAAQVVLTVTDNGVGLDPENSGTPGLGLRSMMYRAGQLGGRLTQANRPGGGTETVLVIPRVREFSSP